MKLSEFNEAMIKHIELVTKHPHQSVVDLYNKGARKALEDFTFVLMIPLAMKLSDMYRALGVRVVKSRELELLLYDMHCKGMPKYQMCVICQIAGISGNTMRIASNLFVKLSGMIEEVAQEHGDTIFFKGDIGLVTKHKSKLDSIASDLLNN